jgi:hypothetical protein
MVNWIHVVWQAIIHFGLALEGLLDDEEWLRR